MAQKTQSKLVAKYGQNLNKAVEKHAEDETDFGFQRLPGGIQNGIAKLTKCYFKEYDATTGQKKADGTSAKGEYYFRAEGVVMEPTHNDKGVPVKGLITSIMIPVCDTKKADNTVISQEARVEEILNELRKLGGDEYTKGATGADLEALAEGLQLGQPFFKFATTVGKTQIDPVTKKPKCDPKTGEPYQPRVWENWYGAKGLESYSAPDAVGQAVEEAPESSTVAQEAPEEPEETQIEETISEVSDDAVDAPDLDALAEQGDLEDESDECEGAQKELTKIAEESGISKKIIKGAKNWAELATMIKEAIAESTPTEEETVEEEVAPVDDDKYEVGKTFKCHNPVKDAKGKVVPSKRAIDVEIMATDADKETCTVKSLIDNKTIWKNVKWADLIED